MKYLNLFAIVPTLQEINLTALKTRWFLLGFVLWIPLESIDFRLFLLIPSEANNKYIRTPNILLLRSFEKPTQCNICCLLEG